MFKKTVLSLCAISLLSVSVASTSPREAYAADKATQAYIAHTSISMALSVVSAIQAIARHTPTSIWPFAVFSGETFGTYWNVVSLLAPFAQAAITLWMDQPGKILAKFTGDEGYRTVLWSGPAESEENIEVISRLADIVGNPLKALDLMPEEQDAYQAAGVTESKNPKELANALVQWQLAKDQGNEEIQAQYHKMLYTAQQQSIWALAEALWMKKTFEVLAEVHGEGRELVMTNQYENTKATLATLAARRALFNTLLVVKYQIARARARVRSETMKIHLTPIANEPTTSTNSVETSE